MNCVNINHRAVWWAQGYNRTIGKFNRQRGTNKSSYREGIDTLEEYKANKAIIQKERESLEQQLKKLKKAAHKSDQDPADAMLQKVRSVYDILISNNYTYVQKNEALKQIIDKIIYDRKNDSLKIYFFLYR